MHTRYGEFWDIVEGFGARQADEIMTKALSGNGTLQEIISAGLSSSVDRQEIRDLCADFAADYFNIDPALGASVVAAAEERLRLQ